LAEWCELVDRIRRPARSVRIGLVGKYVALHDAYLSVHESLLHAAAFHDSALTVDWIDSEKLEQGIGVDRLAETDGIVVPGGFGIRGTEGMMLAARYARENKVPYLGLCLGLQVMVVEFARTVCGMGGANSGEFIPETAFPVVDLMLEQRGITDMGGTMRLGAYPCQLVEGTKARQAYDCAEVSERHRHRYEINNRFRAQLAEAGMVGSGLSPDGRLVEVGEIGDHPWMVGSQFHPEFKSRPNRPHPLFRDFVGAALRCKADRK